MKSRIVYKTIQLVIFAVLAIGCLFLILFQTDVFHQVSHDTNMMILCIALWVLLVVSFVFILWRY